MWQPISTAPQDRDIQLAVIDAGGTVHALVFPCRRSPDGNWKNAKSNELVEVRPTAWREWRDKA